MTELLQNVLLEEKDVYSQMINNVRIRARKKKLELDSANIEIDPKHFDSTLITSYIETTDNYTQGE